MLNGGTVADAADAEEETRIAAEAYIHLLNWARHDPVGYQRGMDLGEDLSYIPPHPPLAINPSLMASAQFHASEEAQYKYFSHQSQVTGDWPNKMARDQGYALPGGWPNDANYIESACMHYSGGDPIYQLILDYDVPSLGHRHHLLGYGGINESNREIGMGLAVDDQWEEYDIIHIAQNGSGDKFLTGMVYSDANGNFRYDLGEGIAGATVVVGGRTAQTDVAGSWSLAVSSGAYTVSVSGASFTGTSSAVVNVGNDNVEVDFISGRGQGIVNFEDVVPPTAKDDQYWVDPGEPLVVSGPGVLMNDLEEDGHGLTARLVAGPAHGTLSLAADGSFTYVPRDSYFSSDTFTYVASDGRYESNATVTLTRIHSGELYRVSNFVPPDGMLGGVVVDDELYFSAGNGNVLSTSQSPRDPLNSSWASQGLEVWKSDGHSMSMVTNLAYGDRVSADPYQYCTAGDAVYFTAENVLGHPEEVGAGAFQLWRLQGSNLSPLGTDADCVGVLNGAVYFLNMGPEQFQLSKYENGVTTAIREFPYEPGRSISKKEHEHVVYQGQLYFHANDALWRTDGTPAGSVKVTDVDPYCLTVSAGALYFWGDIGIGENYTFGFWKYDGATLSKLSLPEDVPTPDFNDGEACSYLGALYFSGFSADWHLPGRYPDIVLWRYNGQTFEELPNEISGETSFTNPRNLCVYDGALYFSASDASGESLSLWRIQPGGMSRVTSLPESCNSILPADDGLYLLSEAFPSYSSDEENYGLWKYLPPLATGPECPGLYAADSSAFFLNDQQAGGDAEHVFTYGVPGIGWVELIGDWNGDGQDTPGFYDPATATFYLTNRLQGGDADLVFQFGIAGQGWKPLVGDWNGDGQDGIGLYEPATSLFFFKNTFAAGDADEAVQFGVGSLGWQPIIGDWDGLPGDGFGFYEPAISAFWLKNAHTSGDAEEMFQFGMGSLGWTPLAGDWDGLPGDGVGFYVPQTGQWFLKNAHAPGDAEISFTYGIGGAGWRPLVGCWTAVQSSPPASSLGLAPPFTPLGCGDSSPLSPADPGPGGQKSPHFTDSSAVDQLDLAALAAEQLQPSWDNRDLDSLFGALDRRRGTKGARR